MDEKLKERFLFAHIWHGDYPFAIVITESKCYFIEPYGSIEVYDNLNELLKANSIDLDTYRSLSMFETTYDVQKVVEFCRRYDVDEALISKMLKEELQSHTPLREVRELRESIEVNESEVNEVLKEWEEYLEQSKPKREPTAVRDIVIEVESPEPQLNLEQLEEQITQLDKLIRRVETALKGRVVEDRFELGIIRGKAIYKEKEYPIYALNSWQYNYDEIISILKHIFKLVKPARLCTRIKSFKRFLLLPVEIPVTILLEPVISLYYNSERALFIIRDKVVYRSGGRMDWNDLEVHSKTINDALYNFIRTPLIREFYSIEVNLDEEKIVSIENTTREKEKSVFDDLT